MVSFYGRHDFCRREWIEAAFRRCNDDADATCAFLFLNPFDRLRIYAERDADANQNWNDFEECELKVLEAFKDFEGDVFVEPRLQHMQEIRVVTAETTVLDVHYDLAIMAQNVQVATDAFSR